MKQVKAIAGPELDAAVAEYVMGWKHWKMKSGRVFFLSPNAQTQSYIRANLEQEVESGDEENAVPYSTDILSAWEVVKKMQADGWGSQVNTYHPDDAVGVENGCYFFTRSHRTFGSGDTPMLAICVAALRANRVEEVEP